MALDVVQRLRLQRRGWSLAAISREAGVPARTLSNVSTCLQRGVGADVVAQLRQLEDRPPS